MLDAAQINAFKDNTSDTPQAAPTTKPSPLLDPMALFMAPLRFQATFLRAMTESATGSRLLAHNAWKANRARR